MIQKVINQVYNNQFQLFQLKLIKKILSKKQYQLSKLIRNYLNLIRMNKIMNINKLLQFKNLKIKTSIHNNKMLM